MPILPVKRNKVNKVTVVRVHYSADPDKNNEAWIKKAMEGMPERGWLREYEIDYSSYAGKPYFPEFREYHIENIEWNKKSLLYCGWDFGYHRPCVVITWLDQFDRWILDHVILGKDEGILEFGKRVRQYIVSNYPGSKQIHACDIAGNQANDKGDKSSVQILNMLGIYPQFRKQDIKLGGEIIRQKLAMRADGKVGLIVKRTENDLIDAFKGGIHYPEAKDGRPEAEYYEKDGYYDHIIDSTRYIATEMFTVIGQTQTSNEIIRDRTSQEYKYRDGRSASEQVYYNDDSENVDNDIVDFFGE